MPDPAARNCCGRLSRGVAIAGNTIFLASFDARIIAIDARTGTELWKTDPAGDPKQGYGTNWYSPSFSPRTGLFYVPAWENTSTTYIKGDTPPEFKEGQGFFGLFPRPGLATDDVHSAILAIDPKTGQKRWTYRLAAPSTEAGVLTTASDVLFSGGRDGSFYALDARTGTLLWQTNLGPSVASGPITYAVNGSQYVSVMAGSAMFTFGLRQPPGSSRR